MKSKFIVFAPLFLFLALVVFTGEVSAASLDLAVDSVSFAPVQPLVDQTTKIIVKVKYTGSSSLTSSTGIDNLAFSHSDFQQISSSEAGLSISPSSSNPLYSGSYFTYTIVGKFTSSGTKVLVLKIDGNNVLSESDENNNSISPKVDVLKSGDLIKLSNNSAVYQIQADGKKHLFVNSTTFWSYYRGNWNDFKLDGSRAYIREITQTAFDSIALGKNITVKSGSRPIKFPNSSNTYVVFGSSKLKLISDQTASSTYGASWKTRMITIPSSYESDYTRSDQDFLDADGDGITDDDERNIYKTNPYNVDSDSDSYKDGTEIIHDYNPI